MPCRQAGESVLGDLPTDRDLSEHPVGVNEIGQVGMSLVDETARTALVHIDSQQPRGLPTVTAAATVPPSENVGIRQSR